MLQVKDEGIILEKRNLAFESHGVLNPTCIQEGKKIHMFYRAVAKGNRSTIGYCQLNHNRIVKRPRQPFLRPEHPYEKHGMEDPRITCLDGTYYMLYTAYDGRNARIAYATSSDLTHFTKHGLISANISYDKAEDIFRHSPKLHPHYVHFEKVYRKINGDNVFLWEKDAILFPKKFNGKFALLHRVLPGIQIVFFNDFSELTTKFWKNYFKHLNDYIVLNPLDPGSFGYVGGGCPPIETKAGWLLIYHSAEIQEDGQKIYHANAALLDLNNPQKVIGQLDTPLFSPETNWEKEGVVDNVVFPTGTALFDDTLFIYYGAADYRIGAKSVSLKQLLRAIQA